MLFVARKNDLAFTVKNRVNLPSGHKLLEECRPMYEYSWFIQQIKDYMRAGLIRDVAITQAVNDCLEEGILVEFMKTHGSEAANMLYTQWNYDEAVAVEREEAYEDGREAGKAIGRAEGIRRRIDNERDGAALRKWCMAAPGVKSFEEFREDMGMADK